MAFLDITTAIKEDRHDSRALYTVARRRAQDNSVWKEYLRGAVPHASSLQGVYTKVSAQANRVRLSSSRERATFLVQWTDDLRTNGLPQVLIIPRLLALVVIKGKVHTILQDPSVSACHGRPCSIIPRAGKPLPHQRRDRVNLTRLFCEGGEQFLVSYLEEENAEL
jgi:hypothetical protein